MHPEQLVLIFLVTYFSSCMSVPTRINFEKCAYRGFNCTVSPVHAPRFDLVFQCDNITTQDVQFYMWQFNVPVNMASLTIQNCERVQMSFTCTAENKPIQWLKIRNVGVLEFIPTTIVAHNPPEIFFENISYIDKIPTNTFSQIKYSSYKSGCLIPVNDSNAIYFKDVNIGTIQTDAFLNLQLMKKLSWTNVSVNRVETRAVNITFENGGCGDLTGCNLGVLEPLAFLVNGDTFSVTRGNIGDIWGNGLNGTIYDFQFSNNTVNNIESGAISILSQNVYIIGNHFKNVQSGAFRKISPGLLHDGKRNFSNLRFAYRFDNNIIGQVEDNSFRPDIRSYKNVNTNMCYSYNTLPCSCEGLAWLKDHVNFGSGYSLIKEFNTMLLDPENSNICSFTPCTCFGGKTHQERKLPTIPLFSKRVITFPEETTIRDLTVKAV